MPEADQEKYDTQEAEQVLAKLLLPDKEKRNRAAETLLNEFDALCKRLGFTTKLDATSVTVSKPDSTLLVEVSWDGTEFSAWRLHAHNRKPFGEPVRVKVTYSTCADRFEGDGPSAIEPQPGKIRATRSPLAAMADAVSEVMQRKA